MSKGPRPPKPPPDRSPSDDPKGPDGVEPICRTFSPENQSTIVGKLVTGDRVAGAVLNLRIFLTCDHGAIGSVPTKVAREMIARLRTVDGSLAGHVDSNEKGSLIVTLCIV